MPDPALPHRVVVYSRSGCHLCEEALAVVERVRQRISFELGEVDIASDPTLELAYGLEIPVVAVDGIPRIRGRVDEAALEAALR